jgi:aminoglycoside phosphotransferase (APT) family kinase protein
MSNPEQPLKTMSKIERTSPLHRVIEMSESEFVNAIQKDFGLTISDTERIAKGYSSEVYRATVDDKGVFIRMSRDTDVYPVEIKGYEIFRTLHIPVPDVVAFQAQPPSIGCPTIILSEAHGAELQPETLSPGAEQTIYTEMGNILSRINSIKMHGFGQLHVKGGELKGKYNTWEEYQDALSVRISNALNFLEQNSILDERQIELIKTVHEEIKALEITSAHLLHRDIHSAHVFIEHNQVSGIIDLGGLEAGDPRYDIATSLVYQSPAQQRAFKNGYGALANDPLVSKYQLLIVVRKIAFRMKHSSPEFVQKTIDLLKQLSEKILSDS